MAILLDNQLLSQLRGKLGNVMIKKYKDKTVITLLPYKKSKKSRKPGPVKKLYENNFAEAVKYAQGIIRNPKLKNKYAKKVRLGQSVYNYAISEYTKLYGIKKGPAAATRKK